MYYNIPINRKQHLNEQNAPKHYFWLSVPARVTDSVLALYLNHHVSKWNWVFEDS